MGVAEEGTLSLAKMAAVASDHQCIRVMAKIDDKIGRRIYSVDVFSLGWYVGIFEGVGMRREQALYARAELERCD